MATITIRKETREERNDVFSFFTTKKALNEFDEIIEVEEPIKENTTKDALLKEIETLQATIEEAAAKQSELKTMITMIDNFNE